MTERPILFSAPMVRALLDGSKTQTRRIIKPQPERRVIDGVGPMLTFSKPRGTDRWLWPNAKDAVLASCRYGQPGDRLWVRETFCLESNFNVDCVEAYPPPHDDGRPIQWHEDVDYGRWWHQPHYAATDPEPELEYEDREGPGVRWKPSIHMPRWVSRTLLEVTAVRAERAQSISEADALAEGVGNLYDHLPTARERFEWLWRSINGDESWTANPWVWVIEFKRITA